ncbi:hypothetical protein BpHYR1_040732 [Brachionus plicatilis]|uniref:Uncharacterized protein n=1 Tax=Brachionus plicatilis TaxID=10195 RepID=A0A3M7Q2D4_BRAPC|nr:hypothetical protein BpHYR1_040732 [Brachionus plicatilis]
MSNVNSKSGVFNRSRTIAHTKHYFGRELAGFAAWWRTARQCLCFRQAFIEAIFNRLVHKSPSNNDEDSNIPKQIHKELRIDLIDDKLTSKQAFF